MDPTFGAMIGSAIGLVAILLGAMFNAHLERRRDDRRREAERRAVAGALSAELEGAERVLQERLDFLNLTSTNGVTAGYAYGLRLDLPTLPAAEALSHRLPSLPMEAARHVALARQAYTMGGMLLRLTAAELENGETIPTDLLRQRVSFIWSLIGIICDAHEHLAGIAAGA